MNINKSDAYSKSSWNNIKGKDVLLVVDLINDFFHPKGALSVGEEQIETIIKKVTAIVKEYYEDPNKIVIWDVDWHKSNDDEFKMFGEHALKDTWGSEIVEELMPYFNEDMVIKKCNYDGFNGALNDTQSNILLKELLKVKSIAVIGVCTDICIMETVGGLATKIQTERYYNDINVPELIVYENCCTTFEAPKDKYTVKEKHEFALYQMQNVHGATIKRYGQAG